MSFIQMRWKKNYTGSKIHVSCVLLHLPWWRKTKRKSWKIWPFLHTVYSKIKPNVRRPLLIKKTLNLWDLLPSFKRRLFSFTHNIRYNACWGKAYHSPAGLLPVPKLVRVLLSYGLDGLCLHATSIAFFLLPFFSTTYLLVGFFLDQMTAF